MVTRTRKMSRLGWLVLALGASWSLLGGCGGGSHSGAVTNRGSGQLSLKIAWPSRPVTDRLVPQAANSMVVSVFQNGRQVATTQPAIKRPQSSYQLSSVPAGFVDVVATAYPNSDGTGTPVASGAISSFQVAAGKTNQAPALTLDSTVKTVTLSAIFQIIPVPSGTAVRATAKDSDGATVLVAPSAWRWTTSNSAITMDDYSEGSTGYVRSHGYGTTVVTATYTEPSPEISASVALAASSQGLATSPWPKHRGGPANTGAGLGRRSTSTARWVYNSATSNTGVLSSPAIGADGTVYVGIGDGQVAAVDGATGGTRWLAKIDDTGRPITSSPAVAANGSILVGSYDNPLYSLIGSTGKTYFRTWPVFPAVAGCPSIGEDGTIYASSDIHQVYAVNSRNPENVQRFWCEGGSPGSVALTASKYLMYGSGAGNLSTVQLATSDYSWTSVGYAMDESVAIAPDGSPYVTSHSGYLYKWPLGSSYWTWRNQVDPTAGHWVSSPAVGPDGTIYVAAQSGRVIAVSPSNGSTLWSFQMAGTPQSSPAVASDGTVYVGSGDGKLYALDGATGQKIWHYQVQYATSVSSPAIGADGAVYFTTGPNVQLHKLAGS